MQINMVEYTLTLDSKPQGIMMMVEADGWTTQIMTPWSRAFPADTNITITAASYGVVEQKGYIFVKWQDGASSVKRTLTLTADTTLTADYEEITYYPTRNPARRKGKFEAKVDHEVYQKRIYALKNIMTDQVKITAAQQEQLERMVGAYLNSLGLTGIQLHHYRNFSQELFSLKRRFQNESLTTEATIAAQKWAQRGLDTEILTKIASLLGITITP
jgi:hypothetical protein